MISDGFGGLLAFENEVFNLNKLCLQLNSLLCSVRLLMGYLLGMGIEIQITFY